MSKGLLKLRKEFGRGEEGLAKWVFNKPGRSWIGSCSKGEAENLKFGEHGTPVLRQIWGSVYVANPFRSGMRSGIRENYGLGRRGGGHEEARAE